MLRDYLTDLFPILELGTSAKMLSVVPLISGGGLFETGAGGSAPKHVQQFVQENYLRWDSLGEFLAIAVSLEHLPEATNNPRAKVLGRDPRPRHRSAARREQGRRPARSARSTTAAATSTSPSSGRRSWRSRPTTPSWPPLMADVARQLTAHEGTINEELIAAQGHPVDIGGYYQPDADKVASVMRPSQTFNEIIASLN